MIKDLWWILLLRGILLILFGMAAMFWPAITFVTLAFVFAFFVLVGGIMHIVEAVLEMKTHRYWWLLLLLGIFELGVGAYALNNPGITLGALILLIGFTFIIRGILEIIGAFEEHYTGSHRILLIIAGALGILAGIIILRYPIQGTLAFTWVMGVYALIAGAITVALSITMKDFVNEVKAKTPARR